MSSMVINPSVLSGKVNVPSSKSAIHRALICGALADGTSSIRNINGFSDDIFSTIEAIESLGIKIEQSEHDIVIHGVREKNLTGKCVRIDCRESGSTLRFMLPVAMLFNCELEFVGSGRLISRPLDTYYKIFDEQSVKYSTSNGNLPLCIQPGALKAGDYYVSGKVSSQFITGLLLALSQCFEDSCIIIEDDLESRPYIDMTIEAMAGFGVSVKNDDYKSFYIKGNQSFKSCDVNAPGDYSQAAFWLAAGAIGSRVSSLGLDVNSSQGDKAIIDILKNMGAKISYNDGISVSGSLWLDREIDVSQCPDLVPIIAAVAAVSPCTTKICRAQRLKYKESDRLLAISSELNKLGAKITLLDDGLYISGVERLLGGEVESHNDHRIAMALAIAATCAVSSVIINGADSVNKSYTNFWNDYNDVGGIAYEL